MKTKEEQIILDNLPPYTPCILVFKKGGYIYQAIRHDRAEPQELSELIESLIQSLLDEELTDVKSIRNFLDSYEVKKNDNKNESA